jgi:O-antigen ligase
MPIQFIQRLTLPIMLVCLFLMPIGYGMYGAILGICLCLLISNRSTIGVFFLLFGVPVVGYIFEVMEYARSGIITVAIGLIFLHFRYPLEKVFARSKGMVHLFVWFIFVLFFFYILGPQNKESFALLVKFVKAGFIGYVAFFYLFRDGSVDWIKLGLLGIFSALLYLAFAGMMDPLLLPKGWLDIGSIRIAKKFIDSELYTHLLALLSVLGFIFIYTNNADKQKTKEDLFFIFIALFTVIILIGWSGARQGMIYLLFGCVSIAIPLRKKRLKGYRLYWIITGITAIMVFFIVIYIGLTEGLPFYESLFDRDLSLLEKLNRKQPFEAALRLFIEKPLLGHGLGGYYIPGKTEIGAGSYAHNFILDLLSQTGLIGIILLFLPFTLKPIKTRVKNLIQLNNGFTVFPLFIVFILHPMISGDFASIGLNIGIIGSMPLLKEKIKAYR